MKVSEKLCICHLMSTERRKLIEGRLKFKEWVFSYPEKLIKIGYIDREYVLSGAVWTQSDF